MNRAARSVPPSSLAVALALGLIYMGWGTTNLAIKVGVKSLPPCLFGGARILSAGLILLAFLALRGEKLRVSRKAFFWIALAGLCLFVGGNGLITVAAKTLPSGVATVLVGISPLFLAIMEALWPWGERLNARGWLGLTAGLSGLLFVLKPRLSAYDIQELEGPLLALGSAVIWALGSFIIRHHPHHGSHLTAASYQMIVGGLGLCVIGLALGEAQLITAESLTPNAVGAFVYLIVVGSLVGFICYNWLLKNVSAALAGTYAYVNPVVALIVGWAIGHEELSTWVLCGMVVIISGVALVRGGVVHTPVVSPVKDEETEETWEVEGISG